MSTTGQAFRKANRHPVATYGLAVVAVALATVITRKTQPIVGEISPFFFAAIMLSTWFGGVGPGLLATALAGFASTYFFYNIPEGSGIFGWDDMLRLSVFVMVALLISSLMHFRDRAEEALRQLNNSLEQRVLERTLELEYSNHQVRDSEEGFRALVEGVTDCAICMLDTQGIVIRWNTGAERIQGYLETEILLHSFDRFYTVEDRERGKPASDLEHARTLGRYEDEGWRIRRDASAFWANVIITPLVDVDGKLRGFAHVARDITEVKRLEKQVLDISEQEQRRIGQDLHDGLGGQLTGIAFLAQNLKHQLSEQSRSEAAQAQRISMLVSAAVEQTREIAQGLSPVELGSDSLVASLRNLSVQAAQTYGIPCTLRLEGQVRVNSHTAAVHLYRIAQEAISNAARHGKATRIVVTLQEKRDILLRIEDNGVGISRSQLPGKGMGLHLMPYRARMIGASFEIGPLETGGTVVQCIYRPSRESDTEPSAA
jgi:PAS domain S-box-containing protein